jgi:hypothetical protein
MEQRGRKWEPDVSKDVIMGMVECERITTQKQENMIATSSPNVQD